jgi:hypothetical protein
MEMDAVWEEGCIANLPFSAFRQGVRIPGLAGSLLIFRRLNPLERHHENLKNAQDCDADFPIG